MSRSAVRVLLVEDQPDDAAFIRELLVDAAPAVFDIVTVDRLAAALDLVGREPVDVILLDLALSDSRGIETFERMQRGAPNTPIIVLTGIADESIGMTTVREGAQDYLGEGSFDGKLLARSIRYAIERKRSEVEIRLLNEQLEQRVSERTSELAAANVELQQRRHEVQDVLDAMSTLGAKLAPDGRILLANRVAQHAANLPMAALENMNFLDGNWVTYDPAVRERVSAAFRRATEGAEGLEDCLGGVLWTGLDATRRVTVKEFAAACDRATGSSVATDLVQRHYEAREPVDLAALWKRLGVADVHGRIVYDDKAPDVRWRRMIVMGPPDRPPQPVKLPWQS